MQRIRNLHVEAFLIDNLLEQRHAANYAIDRKLDGNVPRASKSLRVISIAIGLFFGYIASRTNIFYAFAFLFAVSLLYTIYFLPVQKKYLVNTHSD